MPLWDVAELNHNAINHPMLRLTQLWWLNLGCIEALRRSIDRDRCQTHHHAPERDLSVEKHRMVKP
ncbi:MAG: hypothetical protein HC772_00230 [Leptolyngbyaceae cyanobacterium CRU_2_3]|nr:hypothetical protein [Acaryochloris sp. RU_4_1]NJR52505.1 hypothetical protein [Leptolyngbyaceae cyanobacterium CSU_1_3]NJR64106.1 hypothetical protein [Leptolyngbyaceae cyanobacterium CRU_2_3]